MFLKVSMYSILLYAGVAKKVTKVESNRQSTFNIIQATSGDTYAKYIFQNKTKKIKQLSQPYSFGHDVIVPRTRLPKDSL